MRADTVLQIYKLLASNSIKIWLDGGWGVDALLGKQTRPHNDLDIVVQEKDVQKLREVLGRQGYEDVIRDDTRDWNFVLGDKNNNLVDVHVIVIDEEGKGIYGPEENGICYPADSLKGVGRIEGETVKCLTADYQVVSHSGYKLDENDIHDIKLLCEKFNIKAPTQNNL